MKICTVCKTKKHLSEFYKDKSYKDGIGNRCSVCMKEKTKKYYIKNSELVKEKRNKKYAKNPNAERDQSKLRSRIWRKENPEKVKAQNIIKFLWKNKNLPKVNADTAKRRATKLNATPPWLTKKQNLEIKEFYIMAKELEKVLPWKQHVDHIIPLKHNKVCGLHAPWNLQILSAKMNLEKNNHFEVI